MINDLLTEMTTCLYTFIKKTVSDANFIEQTNLYDVLLDCVSKHFPTSYLEIGVSDGRSLLTVLNASCGLVNRLALCDNWSDNCGGTNRGNHNHINSVLKSVNYQGKVTFYDGDSKETVPTINEKYDMSLIDGDRSSNGCLCDIENTWPLIKDNGIMIIDDVMHPKHRYLLDVVSYFIGFNTDTIRDVIYYTDKPNGVIVIKKKELNDE